MSLPPPAPNEDDRGNRSGRGQAAIFLLSGNVFKDLICSFLSPDDIVELLKVSGLADTFLLGDRFCRTHGTKLDVSDEQQQQNNDDVAFLIWSLEREAFYAREENEELPSTNPDCIDCRKARLEGLKKCITCKEYVDYKDIFTCTGACQRGESCEDCRNGKWQCSLCEDSGPLCATCHDESGGYYCEGCDGEYCRSCRTEVRCIVCSEVCCEDCRQWYDFDTCADCQKTFCTDCGEHEYCSICDKTFCSDCRPCFWCEMCERGFCSEGHDTEEHFCNGCAFSACSDCNDTRECEKCHERCCMDCRFTFSCGQCKGDFCGDCQESKYCDLCSRSFCVSCMDGIRFGGDWACLDCMEEYCLVEEIKNKQNECANCFLSEDDMEGVKLKKCSRCKTTKFCSRACQRAHWPEHRDHCHPAAKDGSETG